MVGKELISGEIGVESCQVMVICITCFSGNQRIISFHVLGNKSKRQPLCLARNMDKNYFQKPVHSIAAVRKKIPSVGLCGEIWRTRNSPTGGHRAVLGPVARNLHPLTLKTGQRSMVENICFAYRRLRYSPQHFHQKVLKWKVPCETLVWGAGQELPVCIDNSNLSWFSVK